MDEHPDAAAALYIEQMSTQGPPEILVDNSPTDSSYGTGPDSPMDPRDEATSGGEAAGCGCQSGGASGTLGLAAMVGLLVRRRR